MDDLRPAARLIYQDAARKKRKIKIGVFLRVCCGKVHDVAVKRPLRDGHSFKPLYCCRKKVCRDGIAFVFPECANHAAAVSVVIDIRFAAVDACKGKPVLPIGIKPRCKAAAFPLVVVLFQVQVTRNKRAEILPVCHVNDCQTLVDVIETIRHAVERFTALLQNVKRRRACQLYCSLIGQAAFVRNGPACRRNGPDHCGDRKRRGFVINA